MKRQILYLIAFLSSFCFTTTHGQDQLTPDQRVIVFMVDGFGLDYLEQSNMPVLKETLMRKGMYKAVKSMIPSVTNCNNASICCGTAAIVHGVVGNTFINSVTGKKEFLESGELVLAPTIFQRAAKHGVKSALFSSKLKTISLLSAGTELTVCPETAGPEWIDVAGNVPDKYSKEVNYWTLRCAIHTLKTRPDIQLLYIHTTDYAMHTWAPEEPDSRDHLSMLDKLIGEIISTAPDAAIFLTADHGMNHKEKVIDLKTSLKKKGIAIKTAISPLADKYPKHHSGYGGISYLYLKKPEDEQRVRKALLNINGVEEVYSRAEAVEKFMLMPERIGDLVIMGDKRTVFGELDNRKSSAALPPTYRTHGSMHERDVPLIIYNMDGAPDQSFFTFNMDIVRWLY